MLFGLTERIHSFWFQSKGSGAGQVKYFLPFIMELNILLIIAHVMFVKSNYEMNELQWKEISFRKSLPCMSLVHLTFKDSYNSWSVFYCIRFCRQVCVCVSNLFTSLSPWCKFVFEFKYHDVLVDYDIKSVDCYCLSNDYLVFYSRILSVSAFNYKFNLHSKQGENFIHQVTHMSKDNFLNRMSIVTISATDMICTIFVFPFF